MLCAKQLKQFGSASLEGFAALLTCVCLKSWRLVCHLKFPFRPKAKAIRVVATMPRSSRDRFQSFRTDEPASHTHYRDQRSDAGFRNSAPDSLTAGGQGGQPPEPQVPKFQDLRAKLSKPNSKSAAGKSSFYDSRDRDLRGHQAAGRNRSPARTSPARRTSPRGRRSRSPLHERGWGRSSDSRRDSRPSDRSRRSRTRSRSPTQRSRRPSSPLTSRRSPKRSPKRNLPLSPGRAPLGPPLSSPRVLTPLMNPEGPESLDYRGPPRLPSPYRPPRSESYEDGPERSYLMPLILPVSGKRLI